MRSDARKRLEVPRTRWLVERTRDDFEGVCAEHFTVLPCGAIEFHNGRPLDRRDRIVYAPGQWLTVCEEEG